MEDRLLGKRIRDFRALPRQFPYCVIVLAGFAALLAAVSYVIVHHRLQDSLLYILIIPCLLGSLFFTRRLYLSMQVLLAGSAVAVTYRISESFQTSLINIGLILVTMAVTTEIIHYLTEEYIRRGQAVQESERRYRTLFEKIPLGVYRTTAQGEITDANQALVDTLGYPDRETLLEANASDLFVNPEDESAWRRMIEEQGVVRGYETQLIRYDGSQIWVEDDTLALYDGQGRITAFQGSVEDISDRVQAEQELARSEKRYRGIVEDQTDLICRFDPSGKLTFVNQAYCDYFGRRREELLGSDVLQFVPEEDQEWVRELYGSLTSEEPLARYRHRERVFGGEIRWAEWQDRAVFDHQGELVEFQSVGRDITKQVELEEALRAREERLGLALEGADLGAWDWDIETGRIQFDQRWAGMLGYQVEEVEPDYEAWKAMVHPQDLPAVLEKLDAHLKGEVDRYEAEFRIQHQSGEWVWVLDRGKVIDRDENGCPRRACGTYLDITERKESERRLSFQLMLLNQIQDKITATDLDGRITYVNQAVCEGLGRSAEELIGEHVEAFGEDAARAASQQEIIDTTLEEGEWRGEVINITADGRELVLESRTQLVRDPAGEPIGLLGISTDISEQRQAERLIKSQKERLGYIIEGTNAGTWEWNVQTGETKFNQKWAEIIGYTLEELEPVSIETWQEYAHPEDLEASARMLEQHFQGEIELYSFECRMKHKDGHWVWVLDRGKVTEWTEDGKPLMMFGTHIDITERKQAEARLKEYSVRLEDMVEDRTRDLQEAQQKMVRQERLAVMGELAGGVAHELRNPLGVIQNAIYYLEMLFPDPEEKVQEYLALIHSETRNANKIITELLDFARIQTAEQEPVEISRLIEGVVDTQLPPAGVDLAVSLPEDRAAVKVDHLQISQVLRNLLSNAYQAMPEGGEVRIMGDRVQRDGEDRIQIRVQDQGVGIPPGDQEKVFEPLFTTKSRGIGLGLAISKKLVQANGGVIELESEVGQGSTFSLIFPPAAGAAP